MKSHRSCRHLVVVLSLASSITMFADVPCAFGQIRVRGPIQDLDNTGVKLDNVRVYIVADEDTRLAAEFDSTKKTQVWYVKEIDGSFLDKKIEVEVLSSDWVQYEPVFFVPKILDEYEEALIVRHKARLGEELYQKAQGAWRNGDLESAWASCEEAIKHRPTQRAYILRTLILKSMANRVAREGGDGLDSLLAERIRLAYRAVETDDALARITDEDHKYRYLEGLGLAIKAVHFAAREHGWEHANDELYDVVIDLFERASKMRPTNPDPFLALTRFQLDHGYPWDATSTAQKFFDTDEEIGERNAEKMLLEWQLCLETAADVLNKDSKTEQLSAREGEAFARYLTQLQKFEYLFKAGETRDDRKLQMSLRRTKNLVRASDPG